MSGDGDLKGGGEDGMVTMELDEVSLDISDEGAVDLNSECGSIWEIVNSYPIGKD